ncbi:MAG: hypothetical protein AB2A00_16045 [Myxococcota bacterium]
MKGWALAFLAVTVLLGLLLRAEFVTGWLAAHDLQFTHLRHAHSHLGFWGVLTLVWWAVARRENATLVSRAGVAFYLACSAVVGTLFAFLGYRALTGALSGVMAAFWLMTSWRQFRMRLPASWLDATPPAMLMATLLVPVVALTARKDPAFSRSLAHVFIGGLMLTGFLPVAWAALRVPRRQPVWLYLILAESLAAFMAFPEHMNIVGAVMGAGFSVVLVQNLVGARLPMHLRITWLGLPVMVALWVIFPFFRGDPWRVAGIHFMVLGAMLPSFQHALVPDVPFGIRLAYQVTLWPMLGSIVAPLVLPWSGWPSVAAVTAGGFVFVVVAAVMVLLARRVGGGRAPQVVTSSTL